MRKVLLGLCGLVILTGLSFAAEKTDAASGATTQYTTDKAALKKIVTGKKILVAYFSLTGNTERVGKDIAECFGADTEKVIDKKNRKGFFGFMGGGKDAMSKKPADIEPTKLDASKYDIVIIGTPIWSWKMTPAIRAYITQNKDKFKDVAFFLTSGSTPAENVVPSMEDLSGKKCIAYVGFNKKELKDNNKYWAKLTKFMESFKQK